jgi:hypothetical protein
MWMGNMLFCLTIYLFHSKVNKDIRSFLEEMFPPFVAQMDLNERLDTITKTNVVLA